MAVISVNTFNLSVLQNIYMFRLWSYFDCKCCIVLLLLQPVIEFVDTLNISVWRDRVALVTL